MDCERLSDPSSNRAAQLEAPCSCHRAALRQATCPPRKRPSGPPLSTTEGEARSCVRLPLLGPPVEEMLLLAGLRLWQQSAGRWRALLQTKRVAAVSAPRQPFTAAQGRLRMPPGLRGAFGSRFRPAGIEQVPFPHAESPCRFFGTSSLKEHPEFGRLIYLGNLSKSVLGVKIFCFTTSMITASMLVGIIFKSGFNAEKYPMEIAFYGATVLFIFLTPFLFHLFTKRYIIRLYHKAKTDTYTAITYSGILIEKRTMFHQKDVTVPDVSKMFTTFYVKRRAMLVNPYLFNYPQDYSHLMGYDKPFQFDLKDSEDN